MSLSVPGPMGTKPSQPGPWGVMAIFPATDLKATHGTSSDLLEPALPASTDLSLRS